MAGARAVPQCPRWPAGRLNHSDGTLARRDLVAVQTPQAFRAGALLRAYDAAAEKGFVGTDTAACLEWSPRRGDPRRAGAPSNLKVTFPEDLALAEELLRLSSG